MGDTSSNGTPAEARRDPVKPKRIYLLVPISATIRESKELFMNYERKESRYKYYQ